MGNKFFFRGAHRAIHGFSDASLYQVALEGGSAVLYLMVLLLFYPMLHKEKDEYWAEIHQPALAGNATVEEQLEKFGLIQTEMVNLSVFLKSFPVTQSVLIG